MRLIDAEPLEKEEGWLDGTCLVIPKQSVVDAPTVELPGRYLAVTTDGTSLHCLPDLEKLHRYCPQCGLKMSPYNGTEVYKIDHAWWEEADTAEGEEDG